MAKRLTVVIPASMLKKANEAVKKYYDPDNDSFVAGLASPDDPTKITHYWMSAQMSVEEFANVSLALGSLTGVTTHDGRLSTPASILRGNMLVTYQPVYSEGEAAQVEAPPTGSATGGSKSNSGGDNK